MKLSPGLHEHGPTWLGRLMDSIGLGRFARALGIGFHSDLQLHKWACEREKYAVRAYRDAMGRLARHDRREAQELASRWHI